MAKYMIKKDKKYTVQRIQSKKISVISTFNEEFPLDLGDILSQTFDDLNIILFYTGSASNFRKLNKKILLNAPNVSLYHISKQENVIVEASQKANSEYIVFWNSSHRYKENFLDQMYNKSKATGADVIFCDYSKINPQTGSTIQKIGIHANLLPEERIFSYKNCPETILNLTGSFLDNKFFDLSFLKKVIRQIPPSKLTEYTLSSICFLLAEKISYLQSDLFCYSFDNQTYQALNYRDKYVYPSMHLEAVLNDLYKYDELEKTFINFSLQNMMRGQNLPEPIFCFWLNDLMTNFSFSEYGESYFYDKALYQSYINYKNLRNYSTELENLFYKNRAKIVPIIIKIQENFDLFKASVSIQSIIEHKSTPYFYDIYVCGMAPITDDQMNALADYNSKNVRVSYLSMITKEQQEMHKTGIFLSNLLSEYDKILLINPNIIFQSDVAPFYEFNLNANIIAGSRGCEDIDYIEGKLGLIYETYISTHLLLLNTSILKNISIEKFKTRLSDVMQYSKKAYQDTLNIFFKSKIRTFPEQWNGQKSMILKDFTYYNPQQFLSLDFSDIRPWDNPGTILADIWWKYARKTWCYELMLLHKIILKGKPEIPQIKPAENKIQPVKNSMDPYLLQKRYIAESLWYFCTIGKWKKKHKSNLEEINNELKRNKM